jgi:hypothetical protein
MELGSEPGGISEAEVHTHSPITTSRSEHHVMNDDLLRALVFSLRASAMAAKKRAPKASTGSRKSERAPLPLATPSEPGVPADSGEETSDSGRLSFHFALNEGGCLMLGPSETVGRQANLFEQLSSRWRV